MESSGTCNERGRGNPSAPRLQGEKYSGAQQKTLLGILYKQRQRLHEHNLAEGFPCTHLNSFFKIYYLFISSHFLLICSFSQNTTSVLKIYIVGLLNTHTTIKHLSLVWWLSRSVRLPCLTVGEHANVSAPFRLKNSFMLYKQIKSDRSASCDPADGARAQLSARRNEYHGNLLANLI